MHHSLYASLVFVILALTICLPRVGYAQEVHASGFGPKAFIDYFRPDPRVWQAFQRSLGCDGGAS